MQLKTRTWFVISLLCFVLAGYFWHLGKERDRRNAPASATNPEPAVTPIKELGADNFRHAPPPLLTTNVQPSTLNPQLSTTRTNSLLTNRLSNTAKTLDELVHDDSAVLLRNALIDTRVTGGLNIPEHLRAQGDPGSYVVQARSFVNTAFRAQLKAVGATIIAYIPNNAYLVRLSESGANRMRSLPQTQSVLPWEPYYKLDLQLLALAVQNQPLAENAKLNVVVFPGEREAGLKALSELGLQILGEDRSPFGPKLTIGIPQPMAEGSEDKVRDKVGDNVPLAPPRGEGSGVRGSELLPTLAALPIVQTIEVHHPRQLVNDLSRRRVGVSSNSYSPPPDYLGLTGNKVTVSMPDTGIDAGHPDLRGRVVGDTMAATIDYDGHGTHVAGTIAGDGSMSPTVAKRPQGSDTNGWNFRGMAPMAKLFAAQIDLLIGPLISDTYLQESAARTNAFVQNNSWGYIDSLDYDSSAASFDESVRDAIPGQSGPTPILPVFAAGNAGGGGSDGQGGLPESIDSPANAKNVITVGAIEAPRGITNLVIGGNGKTNASLYPLTDSDDQVTYFSSRGNVGIGLEGGTGRFKPDLVAPGDFVISCRSDQWKNPVAGGGIIFNRIRRQLVKPGKTNAYDILIPGNGDALTIITRSNNLSPNPFPALPIYAKAGSPPDLTNDFKGNGSVTFPVTPGQWFFAVGDPVTIPVNYDLITIIHLTNSNNGNYFEVLSNLNAELAPWYRYESGTSQAAPAVSGILALMQEFFEQKLALTNRENWPALMKAMLINGSRSMQNYDRQVETALNLQGWGVVNLTNSLPPSMAGGLGTKSTWPIAFFHTNALYTGQSHTRTISLAQFARTAPLRITLVWTDPPGNPAASVKLVNDLDLVVSNNIPNGEVYYGNNILEGSDFNDITDPTDTNAPPALDLVNNVENVFINRPLPGTNFTVTVRAHRVNVNAVTTQTNGVLQDYALVIACGNTLLTNALTVSEVSATAQLPDDNAPFVQILTNGVPRLHQRVGANTPLIDVLNNGITNQWNFYVYNNTSSFTNVAFVTFLAPNLARTRFLEADLDLYVSPNPALTNLDPTVVADAISWSNGGRSARSRGGTELIIYTNAGAGSTFYIGVKSEDQQAAEFGIYAIASDSFGGRDMNGNIQMVFMPPSVDIPDGSPEEPMAAELLAIVADPAKVRRIILTNTFTHENAGDLLGVVSHPTSAARNVVLNSHRSFVGTQTFIYDDSMEYDVPNSQIPDGPGHLRDFIGEPGYGLWRFTMIDNSPYHVGRVDYLFGVIEPEDDLLTADGVTLTVQPLHWKYATVEVPFGVTNMIVFLAQKAPNLLPLDLYLRLGDYPDLTNYDKKATIDMPGGSLSLGVNETPALQPGNRYYIGVYNPNPLPVTFNLRVEFQYSLSPIESQTYLSSDTPKVLPDDAVTNSFIVVTNNRAVADVRVGIRIEHPRIADLVLHLVSPEGTRILLTENRGGPGATNYGYGQPTTFVLPFSSMGGALEARTNIDTGEKSGVIRIDYDFLAIPDELRIYYDGNRIFDSGLISGQGTFSINYGPGLSTVVGLVMNEGNNASTGTVWSYTATITGPWNYATFTDNPNLGPPIKFGVPPYFVFPTNLVVLSNSFESVNLLTNQTNFSQYDPLANTFENWQVVTNGVAIFSDTNHLTAALNLGSTNWGTNFLALSKGQVSLPLTNIVVPDRDYVLNFVQRKISSSPTQSVAVAVSLASDIFAQLSVTNPLNTGESAPLGVPKVRLCPGQEILITADCGVGDTNTLFAGLPLYGLIGCFSFSPEVLTSNTVASVPFYIGTNAIITAPTDPGDYYLFLGVNNNDFNNSPTNCGDGFFYYATAYWQQCQYASGEVLLGANSVPITGSANWKVETKQFLANSTMTNLVLKPGINTTLLFDSFEIDELVSTAYYQSEEPMTPLKGQFALGTWRLEVWDNRSGPVNLSTGGSGNLTNDTGALLSWSLRFVFADSPAAVPLTNGVFYTNTIVRDQIKYFIVAVPNEVTIARNFFFSSGPGVAGIQLLYSPFGLPTGQSPPDPVPFTAEGGPPFQVNTVMPVGATLPRGRFYYLGVRNADPTEVNDFTIHADFNIQVGPLPNGPGLGLQTVAANPYSFADIRANPALAITNMHYYYFDIASTDIVSATFSVSNAPNPQFRGDVNLVLKRALPVVDLFPYPTFFDYESTQPSYGNELIIVNSNSLPVNLTPGRWYVGVYNTTNATARYSIVARRSTTTAPLWNYVDLTNGVPVPFTVSSLDPLTNFYRFVVDRTNSAVVFEIYGDPSPIYGDADLLVKRADLPAPDLYDFSFLQGYDFSPPGGGVDEVIALRTNIFLPDINATNWFLQVVARDSGGFASGWICARWADPVTGMLTDCRGVTITTFSTPDVPFAFTWTSIPGEKYAVEMTADMKTWATAKIIKATGTKTSFSTPAPAAGPPRFYRVKQVPPK